MDPYKIISIFCLCDDLVKAVDKPVRQVRLFNNSEIMLIGIVASLWFGANVRRATLFLVSHRYLSSSLSEGRINRRLRNIPEDLWTAFTCFCLSVAGEHTVKYAVDSFPVPVCTNFRASRCRLFPGSQFRGYNASKKQYFHGLKCHAIVTGTGQVVSFLITPGCTHDLTAFRYLEKTKLPKGSKIYADAAYTDYALEDSLRTQGLHLLAARRCNALRQHSFKNERLISRNRKIVESVFSRILARFPRFIRASSPEGFELKLTLFLLADSVNKIIN